MKLAKFKRIGEHGFETFLEEESGLADLPHYIRLTEYVDVDFPPLNNDAVVEKHLSALDVAEREVRTRFQQALNEIEQQRQELRAITYTPDVS